MSSNKTLNGVPNDTHDNWHQVYGFTATERDILTAAYVSTAIPGAIANGLMIACILLSRKLRENTTSILLLNLAIGDLLVCVVYQPTKTLVMNDIISGIMKTMVFWTGYCLQVASLNGMLCLTIDRFVFICYPFHYVSWMTARRAFIMIATAWSVSFLLLIATISPHFLAKSFIYVVVVFFFMLCLQLPVFIAARRQSRRISNQLAAFGIQNPDRRKANKAIALVMGAFLFCWLPIMITPSTNSKKAIQVSVWFISLNSLVNPVLCCWQFKDVQYSLRKMLGFSRQGTAGIEPHAWYLVRHGAVSIRLNTGHRKATPDTGLSVQDL